MVFFDPRHCLPQSAQNAISRRLRAKRTHARGEVSAGLAALLGQGRLMTQN